MHPSFGLFEAHDKAADQRLPFQKPGSPATRDEATYGSIDIKAREPAAGGL